jgi:SAM-dependent methyltransferase
MRQLALRLHRAPRRAAASRRQLATAPSPPRDVNKYGSALPAALAAGGWECAWATSVTPWEVGAPHAVVAQLCALSGADALPAGPVLVPGAGSGHDAFAYARAGRATVAVDVAATATAACRAAVERDPVLAALAARGSLTVLNAEFFALADDPLHAGRYGVVHDYTFMCALPPAARPRWAAAVARLLAPGGHLVAVLFPVPARSSGGPAATGAGPPFDVDPTHVCELLAAAGLHRRALAVLPDALSHPARAGREWVGRFAATPRA